MQIFIYFVQVLLSADAAGRQWYADCTTAFMIISVLGGLVLFVHWAIANKFGKGSLDRAGFRANSMPFYLPFAVILCWSGLTWSASSLAESLTAGLAGWQQKFAIFSFLSVIEAVIIVFILAAARKYFEGGLRGFGLRKKEIFQDMAAGAAYFIAVWPLVMGVIFLSMKVGVYLKGPDFQMQRNEGLAVVLDNRQWALRLLMVFFITIVTPVFEELIFRGLLQSYLRNIGCGPWQTIFIASIFFSLPHPWMHLPAILILSFCMGYAYEKSGSLWRSIFIHCFFNSSQIAFALLK